MGEYSCGAAFCYTEGLTISIELRRFLRLTGICFRLSIVSSNWNSASYNWLNRSFGDFLRRRRVESTECWISGACPYRFIHLLRSSFRASALPIFNSELYALFKFVVINYSFTINLNIPYNKANFLSLLVTNWPTI